MPGLVRRKLIFSVSYKFLPLAFIIFLRYSCRVLYVRLICEVNKAIESRIQHQMRYRSPLRYPGGKQRALQQIQEFFPSKITEYREPMVGGGSVFLLAKQLEIANQYWINDRYYDLIAFWNTVQKSESCTRLMHNLLELKKKLDSPDKIKDYFFKLRNTMPKTEEETALAFFFFNRVTFSGTTQAGGFSKEASELRFTESSIERLKPMPQALLNARITNTDFRDVVSAEGKNVFIFLDPPYKTAQKLYGKNGELHAFPHKDLAKLLKQTKHKFLITYDDCEEIRSLYKWANMTPTVKEWSLRYGMNNCSTEGKCKVGAELFISNY